MMTIDDYVAAVERELKQPRARRGLDDLRAALAELAAEIGEDAACREFGAAADYAVQLDTEFGVETAGPQRFLGLPVNFRLGDGWWKRVFDPSNPRVLVPHAFGIGWSINFGALAVKVGGLRPDDVDEDTIEQLDPRVAAGALGALVATAAVGAAVAVATKRDGAYPRHWRWDGRPDRWGSWSDAVAAPVGLGLVGVAVVAMPTVTGRPCVDRLAAQAVGCGVLGTALGQAAMAIAGRDGRRVGWAALLGPLVGIAAGVATLVVPFRAAVRSAAAGQEAVHSAAAGQESDRKYAS